MTAAVILCRRLGGVGDGGLDGMSFTLKKRSLKRETDGKMFVSVHSWFYPANPEERAKSNSPLMQLPSSSQAECKFEEWVELANGCICCTVKHSLVQALKQLVQGKERLDHILLETTGLVNPAPLACLLRLDEQLESLL
ncbi:hypothetical protein NL676_021471 [Syzygium grande]|nr:hypothetical protein NL676_021471 [Syzygium grande]